MPRYAVICYQCRSEPIGYVEADSFEGAARAATEGMTEHAHAYTPDGVDLEEIPDDADLTAYPMPWTFDVRDPTNGERATVKRTETIVRNLGKLGG